MDPWYKNWKSFPTEQKGKIILALEVKNISYLLNVMNFVFTYNVMIIFAIVRIFWVQDFDNDNDDTRVHLLIHDLKPPFLDGKTVFTKQLEPVSAVRDPQSDMAVFARKGSKVVKERRQQKERQKQAQEATGIAGTALGNIMGAKEEDTDSAAPLNGENEGEKNPGSKFAEHMKKKAAGASDFSRTKSLREQ